MRIILKVSSTSEHCDGGCEFAIVDLTAELAGLALNRIATLIEQKSLDRDIIETYYWTSIAEYFSPWGDLPMAGNGVDGPRVCTAELLDQLQVQEKEVVCAPESFQVSPSQTAAVECEQMVVREGAIAFIAIPKHASYYVETAEIPLALVKAAARRGLDALVFRNQPQ
jgi:hypothetical protein